MPFVPSGLLTELYKDVKYVAAATWNRAAKGLRWASSPNYSGPAELNAALRNGQHEDGDLVTIDCRPSLLGPFLRYHFLTAITGNHTGMRLGPKVHLVPPGTDALTAMVAMTRQTAAHYQPVGLFPALEGGVQQACLYPVTTYTYGYVSALPVPYANMDVPYVPALLAPRYVTHCYRPCRITGALRIVTPDVLMSATSLSAEAADHLRSLGRLWILDATGDESDCAPNLDVPTPQFWGGLYASGHIEFKSGTLKLEGMFEALASAMKANGFDYTWSQNKGIAKEVMIFAPGLRIRLDSSAPIYSVHMDAEMATGFHAYRTKFDAVCERALANIAEYCRTEQVELSNPHDLDFSYTNSARAYTVMRSQSAELIAEPLALAVRDWHRKRSQRV